MMEYNVSTMITGTGRGEIKKHKITSSVANLDQGPSVFSVMFIPDPGSEFFPSRIQDQKDSASLIRIKEFKYF